MPDVMNEWETIDYLVKHRCGISRYGDGELKLCLGQSTKTQVYTPQIAARMREILKSKRKECLVAIPRFNRVFPTEKKKLHWAQYNTQRYNDLYRPGKTYGSAYITRLDEIPDIDCPEYWERVKQIWRGRSVVVLQGERKPFLKRPDIIDGAASVKVLYGPVTSAFLEYAKLLFMMTEETTVDDVVIIALGATATVMAYDLSLIGRQALDLGHMGMFYARAHSKQTGEKDGF
jgi:glycosyltransferase family protein